MNEPLQIEPDWKWCTAEGSREFDRLLDRRLTFREKLQWLEAAESLSLRLNASRERARKLKGGFTEHRTPNAEP
jgi:hypothetical protein